MPASRPASNALHQHVEICPYLGIEEDAQTCLGYPSLWNGCHHVRPMAVVCLSHQRHMCLSALHSDCPVFRGEKDMAFPAHLRAAGKASKQMP